MKQLKSFLTVLLIGICTSAYAQYDYEYDAYGNIISNSHPIAIQDNSYGDSEEGSYNIYLEYSPMRLKSSVKGADSRIYHTATIGISYDFQLGYDSPAFIEGGFEASGSWFSKRYYDGSKYSMDLYYSKIPVSLAFRLNLADGLTLVPFGGLSVKYNISGEDREKDEYGNTDSWQIFDEDYTYDDDYKRLQLGYQAGLRLLIGNSFSIGASWKADLTPFCKYYDSHTKKEEKEKFQGFALSLAYCF